MIVLRRGRVTKFERGVLNLRGLKLVFTSFAFLNGNYGGSWEAVCGGAAMALAFAAGPTFRHAEQPKD